MLEEYAQARMDAMQKTNNRDIEEKEKGERVHGRHVPFSARLCCYRSGGHFGTESTVRNVVATGICRI